MNDPSSKIETHGSYSPGVVHGNFTINQTIIKQYEKQQKTRWRKLEHIHYPVLSQSDHAREMFVSDLAFALHKVFAKTGYVKFVGLARMIDVERNGHKFPIYVLTCHYPEFCEAARQLYKWLIENALAVAEQGLGDEGKNLIKTALAKDRGSFQSEWNIHIKCSLSSEMIPWQFTYDPATKRIEIEDISEFSVQFSDYPDGVTTTSELICYIASLSRTVFGYFGDLVWLEDNYSLTKLLADVLDNHGFDLARIRINANDYEEWDYVNTAFDEEVRNKKLEMKRTNKRRR